MLQPLKDWPLLLKVPDNNHFQLNPYSCPVNYLLIVVPNAHGNSTHFRHSHSDLSDPCLHDTDRGRWRGEGKEEKVAASFAYLIYDTSYNDCIGCSTLED